MLNIFHVPFPVVVFEIRNSRIQTHYNPRLLMGLVYVQVSVGDEPKITRLLLPL
jgi:hypothetical protein